MIRSAVRTTLRSLLRSDLVAELNQTVLMCRGGFNDGRVELFQQLLWQVERPQLAKKYSLCWAFFTMTHVIVPLQVLGDGGAKESEYSTIVDDCSLNYQQFLHTKKYYFKNCSL